MIKIGDGTYYITCGDACLVMRERGGLEDVCFGRRIEFEDDVAALGVVGGAAFRAEIFRAGGGNKNLADELKLVSAEVVPSAGEWAFPVIRAEKTLKVRLATDGLDVELYFTPHIRGGISRRCAVVNTSSKPTELRSLGLGGITVERGSHITGAAFDGDDYIERVPASRMRSGGVSVAVCEDGCDEDRGEAIGVYPVYGGSVMILGAPDGDRLELMLPLCKTLAAGERLESPEALFVYSDRGFGGLNRAFHDIVRDGLIPEKYAGTRRPIAFCATGKDGGVDAARTVGMLGADTYITDIDFDGADGTREFEKLVKLGDECSTVGVKLGALCNFETVDETSDVPTTDKLKGRFGARIVDLTSPAAAKRILDKVDALAKCGVKHIKWENADVEECFDTAYEFEYTKSGYAILAAIADRHPDMVIEGGAAAAPDLAQLAFMPYYGYVGYRLSNKHRLFDALPPCAIGDYIVLPENVRSSFKTDFDAATTGGLSYIFDPALIDERVARAIRAQIFSYQDDAALAVGGDLYRLCEEGGAYAVALVSKDKARAYVVFARESGDEVGAGRIKLRGLDAHNLYHVRELGKTFSGAALSGYGVDVGAVGTGETAVFHLRQVVDYE